MNGESPARCSLFNLLRDRFLAAIAAVAAQPPEAVDAALRPAGSPKFGEYQCNAAMGLSRPLAASPRDVAQRIAAVVDLAGIAEPLEVAGPGFLNVRLKREFLADYLAAIPPPHDAVDRLGIPPVGVPQRVVVDYSSPNVAKQMHVGHLRSTIIGDVLARVLGFLGHDVVRQNHIGDWGTSMGMVILGLWYIGSRVHRGESVDRLRERLAQLGQARAAPLDERRALLERICSEWSQDLARLDLDDLTRLNLTLEQLELGYQIMQALIAVDEPVGVVIENRDGSREKLADIPRKVTRMLQAGGPEHEAERRVWQEARRISLDYCDRVYRRLNVLLTSADVCGESFYEDQLASVVDELTQRLKPGATAVPPRAELRLHEGALCLFLYDQAGQPQFRNADGLELPMLIRKTDGAYLYATTDLAAVRYRTRQLGAQRVIYVVGAPQRLHFQMLFAAAQAVGWTASGVVLEHVAFGSILGPDRKPIKTREGKTPKLADLLELAVEHSRALLEQREADEQSPLAGRGLDDAAKQLIAERVGIAAVKYNDLSNDRNSDYVFDEKRMLALKGNTAPYLLYAYTRARAIGREAIERFGAADLYTHGAAVPLDSAEEWAVALRLARFHETLEAVARELAPHILCSYLYDLAGEMNRFYEACPVLRAESDALRLGRLRLCDLTARTLKTGLWLLGIDVIERM